MGALWENLCSKDICPITLAQGYASVGGAVFAGVRILLLLGSGDVTLKTIQNIIPNS